MRHRILYIMNVDWDWAKQRPHFIAQHLSCSHDVRVLYPYAWRRTHLVKNSRNDVKLYPIFRIPFGGRIPIIRKFNALLFRVMAKMFLKWHQPEIVWISSPELIEYFPKGLTEKLVYDCMDDVLAFPSNAPRRGMLETSEKELIAACSHVFCSSVNLRNKLISRAGYPEKYSVIHNAFEPSSFVSITDDVATEKKEGRVVLGYVGTISTWMDFDMLVKIVHEFTSVEIHLMGPIENLGMSLPQHERIKYLGAVRHVDLLSRIRKFDALIMPFQVTELIQSVDPVKLYEYVFFNKPIMSVRYVEIERFSEFIDFYTDYGELRAILHRYLNEGFKKKYSDEARGRFIAANTWTQRVVSIENRLGQLGAETRVQ